MGIEPSEVIVIIVSLLENAGLEHCIHAVNICCMHASLNKKSSVSSGPEVLKPCWGETWEAFKN